MMSIFSNVKKLKVLSEEQDVIIADSLMLKKYQKCMLEAFPDAIYVYLDVDKEVLFDRLLKRKGHFFTHEKLEELISFLQEPVIDAAKPLDEVLCKIRSLISP